MRLYICTQKMLGNNRVFFTRAREVAIKWCMDLAREVKKNKDAVADQQIQTWEITGTAGDMVFLAAQLGASIGADIGGVELDVCGGTSRLKHFQERTVSGGVLGAWRYAES